MSAQNRYIGKKLKERREELNKTVPQVARTVGMRTQTLLDIEKGKEPIYLGVLYSLSKELQMPMFKIASGMPKIERVQVES